MVFRKITVLVKERCFYSCSNVHASMSRVACQKLGQLKIVTWLKMQYSHEYVRFAAQCSIYWVTTLPFRNIYKTV